MGFIMKKLRDERLSSGGDGELWFIIFLVTIGCVFIFSLGIYRLVSGATINRAIISFMLYPPVVVATLWAIYFISKRKVSRKVSSN